MKSKTSVRDVSLREAVEAPTHQEIAARAYERYLERGSIDGADLDDWLEAERELLHRRTEQIGRAEDWVEDR